MSGKVREFDNDWILASLCINSSRYNFAKNMPWLPNCQKNLPNSAFSVLSVHCRVGKTRVFRKFEKMGFRMVEKKTFLEG